MKNNLLKNIYTCALLLIVTVGCKKTVEPQPAATQGDFSLHLHSYVDTSEVENYGDLYTMTGGRKISVDMSQLYISHIELVKLDGSTYSISDSIILQVQENEIYNLGKVPSGNYKGIRFRVGLDATKNQIVPVSGSLNKSEMWFSTSAQPDGFVFLNFQGTIDTTVAANGLLSDMVPFVYKIGTNAHYEEVDISNAPVSVISNQTQFIHLTVDYSKLFDGILLTTPSNLSVNTVSDNTSSNAQNISNNISSMFTPE
jgi:hypothetical protein